MKTGHHVDPVAKTVKIVKPEPQPKGSAKAKTVKVIAILVLAFVLSGCDPHRDGHLRPTKVEVDGLHIFTVWGL